MDRKKSISPITMQIFKYFLTPAAAKKMFQLQIRSQAPPPQSTRKWCTILEQLLYQQCTLNWYTSIEISQYRILFHTVLQVKCYFIFNKYELSHCYSSDLSLTRGNEGHSHPTLLLHEKEDTPQSCSAFKINTKNSEWYEGYFILQYSRAISRHNYCKNSMRASS